MSWYVSPLVAISFATSAVAASVALVGWRRRAAPGAPALALLMLAVAEWTFFRGLEAAAVDVSTKVWWAKLEYFGNNSIGPLWLVFALHYSRQVSLPPRSAGLLWVVPALSVLLAMTNEHHHLIWTAIQPNPRYPAVLMYSHGAWFWVMVAYAYVLLAAGAVVLLMAIARFPAAFRTQAAALLLAVALPWGGNLVYLLGHSPIPGLDLTPLAMTLSGIIGAWVVLCRDLFNLIPVARETLVEKLADGVIVLDERARIIDLNPAAMLALGLAPPVVGAPAAAVLAPWPDLLTALDPSANDAGEIVTAGPRFFDFRVSRLLDVRQRVTGSLVSLRDITERRWVEQEARRLNEQLEQRVSQRTAELRLSQERFETLARVAPVGIYRTDTSGRITYVNDTWREITGVGLANEQGAAYVETVHPDDRRAATPWALTPGSPERYPIEMHIQRPDGAVVWVMNHLMADVGSDGSVRGAIGTLVDITELKRAQEQQAGLASLVENSPDLVAIFGPERRLVYMNAAGRRMVGLGDVADERARTLLDFIAPEGQPLIEEVIAPAIRDHGCWDGEALLRRVDTGESVVLAGRCFVLRRGTDADGLRVAILGRDITERKRAEAALRETEAQLRHAQKMEAVGRLAGGIAHDFNNLMAIVVGEGELLEEMGAAEDERRQDSLVLIQEAARRAIGLTRQLLAISRKQLLQRTVLDLNEVISGVSGLLQRVMGESIEVSIALAPDLARVRADSSQIEQVLLNLVVNARDAMSHGGRLAIETENAMLESGTAPGHYAMLTLTDTGTGIPPEILAHIFEPFVTTKGPGEGTGLGLATVYGIVQQHGGHIAVDTAVGRGTTFRIYLPAVADRAVAQAERLESTPRGLETILLVEDEADVRTVISRSLQALGYSVIEASSADEALYVMESRGDDIDLVLTDVVMPRKTGRELGNELHGLWPGLPVIFMSGYADEAIADDAVDDRSVVLIPKPFTRSDLARAVRAALDQSPGPSSPMS